MDFKRITGFVTGAVLAVLGLVSPAMAGDIAPGPDGPGQTRLIDMLRQLVPDLRIAERPGAETYAGAYAAAYTGTYTDAFPGKAADPADGWTAFGIAGQAPGGQATDWNRNPGTADVPEIDLATVMAFLRRLDPVEGAIEGNALAYGNAAIRMELTDRVAHGDQAGAAIVNAIRAAGAGGPYDGGAFHGPEQVLTARFLTGIGVDGSLQGGTDGGADGGGGSYALRAAMMAALNSGYGADAGTEDATGLTGWIQAGGSSGGNSLIRHDGTVSDMAAWSLRPAIHGAGADSSGGLTKVDLAGAAGIGGKDWVVRNQLGTGTW